MRPSALNLLRHPRPGAVAWRQHLGWGLAGMALPLLLGAWLQAQHSDWSAQLQQERRQQAQQHAELQSQRALREQQRLQAQQQAAWQALQTQQQRVLALQLALQREAEQGLRLARWQADGQRLLVQGQSLQPESVPDVQARLGQALGQRWALVELAAGPADEGVSWSLETPWPPASAPRGAP